MITTHFLIDRFLVVKILSCALIQFLNLNFPLEFNQIFIGCSHIKISCFKEHHSLFLDLYIILLIYFILSQFLNFIFFDY